MITSLILFLAVSSVSPDRVDMAIESYRGVESYKVTLRSRSAEDVGGRPSIRIAVEGNGNFSVDGIHRYILWFDRNSSLPIKAASYDVSGELIEEVSMDDLEMNPALEGDLFDL